MTYQDVVRANQALWAWALVETSGLTFAPYIGVQPATGAGTFLYQQTGPFAASVSLKANTTGYVTVPFPGGATQPAVAEFWLKLNTVTPAAASNIFGTGTAAAQSTGFYVTTAGRVRFSLIGVGDYDTLYDWPDTNWHLVQVYNSADLATCYLAVDTVVRFTHTLAGGNFPANSVWSFGANPAGGAPIPSMSLAMIAIYQGVMGAQNLYATYLAATDPATALGYVRGTGGDVLQQILDSVRKAY